MKKCPIEIRLTVLTSALIFFLGTLCVWSWFLLDTPKKIPLKKQSTRALASQIQENQHSLPQEFPKMLTLKIGCLTPNSSTELFQSEAKQIQITTSLCHLRQDPFRKGTIINTSNGFEGTLFQMKPRKFITDYIYLKRGLNKIHLSYELSSGKKFISEINIFNSSDMAFQE